MKARLQPGFLIHPLDRFASCPKPLIGLATCNVFLDMWVDIYAIFSFPNICPTYSAIANIFSS